MKILILLAIILSGCYPKSFEMEQISKDVLNSKSKEGIEIDVKPIVNGSK